MKEHELLWDMLPDGLKDHFDVESYEKNDQHFRITLIEKNCIPELPEEYQNKQVINTVIKPITVDYFPIKGRKGELVLKRRCWKFDGIDKWLKREINICAPGTKLESEFAAFLKELYLNRSSGYQFDSSKE